MFYNINIFANKILEGVITMGEIFLNLIKTGNVLFKNWSAVIYCDSTHTNTMKVNFGLKGSTSQSIIGLRKNEKTTINSLNKTIKFLDTCYKEWLKHVDEHRNSFNELNYFRIDQIVILRMKLAEFVKLVYENQTDQDDDFGEVDARFKSLFDLLFVVNRAVDVNLLNKANDFAFKKDLDAFKEDSAKNGNEKSEANLSEENSEEIEETIKFLLDLNFSKKVIKNGNYNCEKYNL